MNTNQKSAIDLAFYAAGKKDKFRGTGVFNFIELKREPKDEAANAIEEDKKTSKSTKSVEKVGSP